MEGVAIGRHSLLNPCFPGLVNVSYSRVQGNTDFYSARRAIVGFTFVARRAGT